MVGEGDGGKFPVEHEPRDGKPSAARSHSSGLIFAVVALALILAISFFYVTKDREKGRDQVVGEDVESADDAARVIGDAAENAADQLSH